jgi:KDO2-lipid IV(A) lauroyltransferase
MAASAGTAAADLPWRQRLVFLPGGLAARLVGALIAALPRRAMLALGTGLGGLAYRLMRARRRIALDNLRAVFGDSKSPAEIECIARESFRNVGASLVELLWLGGASPEEIERLVEFDAASRLAIEEAHARGRGVVVIPIHFGRWELMGLAYNRLGHTVTFIAKALSNPYVDAYLNAIRCRGGNRVLHMGRAGREIIRVLRSGGAIAALIDQKLSLRRGGILVDFLGRPAATTPGIAKLAIRHGAALLPIYCLPLPDGRCRVVAGPIVEYELSGDRGADVCHVTRLCLAASEAVIRKHPEYWTWGHKRWKLDRRC